MLRILGSPRNLCDGVSRRDFLRLGALGAVGLSDLLALPVSGRHGPNRLHAAPL